MISGIIKWLQDRQNNIVIPKTLAKCVFTEGGNNLQTLASKALYLGTEGSTTQLPSVNPTMIISDLDYSTEEQLTGKRWIDGKPIYQKTIVLEKSEISNSKILIENVDSIIDQYGYWIYDDTSILNHKFPFPREQSGTLYCFLENVDKSIVLSISGWQFYKIVVTTQYTKSTDTELSPVDPPKIETIHAYSEDEQVVGTWIDGKPIYEKTYILNNISLLKGNNIFDTIENVKIINSKGSINDYSIPYGDGGEYVMSIRSNNGIGLWSNKGFYGQNVNIILTINYIKTTD